MKNPRGRMLWMLSMIAMFLFVLGPIQGNPTKAEKHDIVYSMNSPPGQMIIAVIEMPTISYCTSNSEMYIQIARGVSVPDKGLLASVMRYNTYNESSLGMKTNLNAGDVAVNLGLRSTSLSIYPLFKKPRELYTNSNQLRGVNTRLTDYKLIAKT